MYDIIWSDSHHHNVWNDLKKLYNILGKDVMREINNDRPCHLILQKHAKYGDHSVLAVGYQQFVYEHWYGDNCETYIRIADGWTCNASRFVWGGCKGTWDYVSINIK